MWFQALNYACFQVNAIQLPLSLPWCPTPTLSFLLSSLVEKGIQNTLLIFACWRENLGGIKGVSVSLDSMKLGLSPRLAPYIVRESRSKSTITTRICLLLGDALLCLPGKREYFSFLKTVKDHSEKHRKFLTLKLNLTLNLCTGLTSEYFEAL